MLFDQALDALLKDEGGYTNNPNDAGGETQYGITTVEARARGYGGPMKDLPIDFAKHIYTENYWTSPGFDKVASHNETVAVKLFNAGVNVGTRRVIGWLQTILNGLNRNQADYPDVQIDMACGPSTVSAMTKFLQVRGKDGETVLLRAINAMQGAHYIGIATSNVRNEEFLFGWLLNRTQ